jgi:hypothetical protein
MVAMIAGGIGGIRALGRAMAADTGADLEPTVRRWLALPTGEQRPIVYLNGIIAQLAKFSRSETRKMGRRIGADARPAGNRQAVVAYLSMLYGANKPEMLTSEQTLAAPIVLVVAAFLAIVIRWGMSASTDLN